ncbi:ComEC/Rec2 family competence protein [Mangrovibacterium sp.]|uniref:ComEC/Rec2 family competence protein n=1 Tax=Mangrovibacterium sp. TaxID=1961364 RepID=UPI003569B3A7
MKFFANNPFLKILGFWIAGLLTARHFPILLIATGFILLFFLCWSIYLSVKRKYPFDLALSATLASLIFLLSALNYKLQHPSVPSAPVAETHFLGSLLENPTEKPNSFQCLMRIDYTEPDSLIGRKLICWIEKSPSTGNLQVGDQLFCKGRLNRVENRGNPFEFDYKAYLEQQSIFYSCYLKTENITIAGGSPFSIRLAAEKFRNKLLAQLRSQLPGSESFQVISALTLGYRKELMPETRAFFTTTGAMHVLAVSGLHVGLIFMFLLRLSLFLKHIRKGKLIRFILIATFLWLYALITGFSPSVQRATTMFTFLLIAESTNRTNSIYNSIAASAFALILINPDILFAVGFQLSYAAVLSIVYFYPKLEQMLPVRNKLLAYPWQLLCVSVAAQIGTFPLSIYYFNQFPVYFWLSNFVVIPAAFILLSGTLLFFLFSALPPISKILAIGLDFVNTLVLDLLKFISQLPGALVENISITFGQLTLLVSQIVLIIIFIHYKRARLLQLSLLCFVLFQIIGINNKLNLLNQHKLLIYQGKNPTFHFINGRENYLISSDTSNLSPYIYSMAETQLHLHRPHVIPLVDSVTFRNRDILIENQLCQFGNETYLWVDIQKKTKLIKHARGGDKPTGNPQINAN